MRALLAIPLLGVVLLPSSAGAQAASPVLMSIAAGGAMPLGDLGDFAKTGFNVAGSVEFSPSALPFALRIDLGYTKFGEKSATFDDGTTTFNVQSNISNFAGTMNAVFGASAAAQVRPYAIGGIGFYNTNFDLAVSGGGIGFAGDDSEGSFGMNVGAGLRFRMSQLSTFIEGRYHYVLKGAFDTDENSDDTYAAGSYFPVVFGISFGR